MRRWTLPLLVLLFAQGAMGIESFDLKTLQTGRIVVADDAIPSERYAAEEFQSLLEQALGFEMPVSDIPALGKPNVYIGPGAWGLDTSGLGEEGLRIVIDPKRIVITGGRPRGTLYGVYEFMERYLGVRFLTVDHTYAPKREVRRIPCEEWSYTPPFSFRWSYYKENAERPEFAARLRVNTTTHDEKLGGVSRQSLISHSLNNLLPVSKYGKEHPEYYALVDGERKLEMWGGGPEPCVTNPDVIEIVAENVIQILDKNPSRKNYSVSQNDNDAYCRCENCEAINQREGTPMGSHLAFVNAVAERVEKKHPGVKIGTLAYWYTRKPPKTIQPRHNVQIQLCSIECSTLYPLNDPTCGKNRPFCTDMDEWGKICKDIWVWNYNTNFRFYDLPFPNLRSITPNVRYFLDNNVKGLFMQANGNGGSGELCDLRNYVISRCIWNPELDSWELAKEFCRLHYGKAGSTMIRYITFLHDNAERAGFEPTCFPMPFELGLNPETSDLIYSFFQNAMKQAGNDTVRDRVEKASICSLRAVLETGGQFEVENGILRVSYPKKYGDLVSRYKALTQKHSQTRAEEWEPISHYFNILDHATVKGYRAERLENETWMTTVMPGANGIAIELLHKPSGKHLLMHPDYRCLRRFYEYGTLEETGEKGYDQNNPKSFTAEKDGTAVLTLTKKLKDGSTFERRIRLDGEAVQFQTCITHRGGEPKVYQFRVNPEWVTGTITNDSSIISAYVKDGNWVKFNQDWHHSDGPNKDLLENARGGGLAFYNHQERFGVMQTYDPASFEKAGFWWSDSYPQANLDLYTKPVNLEAGGSFNYEYRIEYLNQPPK